MVEGFVETDVDLLVSLVKEKKKIAVEDAAKVLQVPLAVLQKWVDFLLEEEVLGIEYKFVTPYLYFNKDPEGNPLNHKKNKAPEESLLEEKDDFFSKAASRGLNKKRVNELWQKYLESNLEDIKEMFWDSSKQRGLPEHKTEELWLKYYTYLKRDE